jgi:hypothetical protein
MGRSSKTLFCLILSYKVKKFTFEAARQRAQELQSPALSAIRREDFGTGDISLNEKCVKPQKEGLAGRLLYVRDLFTSKSG